MHYSLSADQAYVYWVHSFSLAGGLIDRFAGLSGLSASRWVRTKEIDDLMFASFVTRHSWNKAPSDRVTTQTGHTTEAGQTRSLERMHMPKVNWCSQPYADNP